MAEKEQQESAPEPEEKVLPAPVFTEASADKQTSAVDPDAIAKRVAEMLLPEVEKRVQSVKDRRFDRIEKSLADLAELEARGATIPDSVKQEARLMDMVESRLSSAPVARSEAPATKFDTAAFLKDVGLDGNDADVIKELLRPHRNEDHLRAEMLNIKNRQLSASPGASAPPALQGGGGATTENYAEKMRAELRGPANSDPFDSGDAMKRGGGVFVK